MNILSTISDYFKKRNDANRPFCSIVVAAGGRSSRMGDVDKLMCELGGIPVIAHTLMKLNACEHIDEIIVSTLPDSIVRIADIGKTYNIRKLTKVVAGGASRLHSVYNGVIEASKDAELIGVHDGARPLVSNEVLIDVIDMAALFSAAIPGVPCKDTLKEAKNNEITATPDRSMLYAAQTPQVFNAKLITAALKNAIEKELPITDDASAVEAMGLKVHISKGDYKNIKITTPEDLVIAEALLNMED